MAGKPLSVAIGWSTKPDAIRAGKEAADTARERMNGPAPRLAIAFGSSWFDQARLLEGLRSVLGDLPVVGGSTAGEIGPNGPLSHSCIVMLLASDTLVCSIGSGEAADRDPRKAGHQAAYAAARAFPAAVPRTGFLLFGDGLVSGYGDVVRGIQEVLGTGAVIVGGTAGDDFRFARTVQYAGRRVVTGGVTGALLGGVAVGVGIEHGFEPISKPRAITRAKGNVLFELDRLPAASVYEEYFGTAQLNHIRNERMSRQAVAYPLGIRNSAGTQWLLRNVIDFHADGSLACSGEMFEGGSLQLMIGSRQLALEAARNAAERAVRSINRASAVLVFDSAARKTLLGPRYAELELRGIRDAVGAGTPVMGCYTYGEQAVFGQGSVYDRMTIQTGSVLAVALGDA